MGPTSTDLAKFHTVFVHYTAIAGKNGFRSLAEVRGRVSDTLKKEQDMMLIEADVRNAFDRH